MGVNKMVGFEGNYMSNTEKTLLTNQIEISCNKVKFNGILIDTDYIEDGRGNLYVRYYPTKEKGDLK